MTEKELFQQLDNVIAETNFDFLGEKYSGKVRDTYLRGKQRILVTSDRLSCFDVIVTTIPFKGQVLNQMAVSWFAEVQDIIPNHLIAVPDPNVMIAHNCEILPIEVVVRAYLTGSAWRDYQAGRAISGVKLPSGLKLSQAFEKPLITPSTKAAKGEHDQPISEADIIASKIIEPKLWQQVRETALSLFERGQKKAAARGLILVDTKYEFGLLNGKLVLADEIHTLDSSRYWLASSYDERFEAGQSPEMLDKEPVRQWLIAQGFQGEGQIPEFSNDKRVEIAADYIAAFEKIVGKSFQAQTGDALSRIQRELKKYFQL